MILDPATMETVEVGYAKLHKVTRRAKLHKITYVLREMYCSHYILLAIVNVDSIFDFVSLLLVSIA